MGYNLSGITINKNFNSSTEELLEHLKWPLEFVKEVTYEESITAYLDDDVFDIFFSKSGTLILSISPDDINPKISNDCEVLRFMISETTMSFFIDKYVNGLNTREYFEQEGEIKSDLGTLLEEEINEDDAMEKTMNIIQNIFGENLYNFDLTTKGQRYKLVKLENVVQHISPFYNSNTMATNAGKLNFNIIQWIKLNLISTLKNTILLFFSGYLMIKIHWTFGILFFGALLYNIWYWFTTYNTFKAGDVNPGKVICLNPDKIAVATNMSKFGGNFPILRIIETKLPQQEKKIGIFIPTIALYSDNPHGYPFWAKFHPIPLSHGTSSKNILKTKFDSFSTDDFEILNRFINQVKSQNVGTYKMDKEISGWKDFPNVELGSINKMKAPEK